MCAIIIGETERKKQWKRWYAHAIYRRSPTGLEIEMAIIMRKERKREEKKSAAGYLIESNEPIIAGALRRSTMRHILRMAVWRKSIRTGGSSPQIKPSSQLATTDSSIDQATASNSKRQQTFLILRPAIIHYLSIYLAVYFLFNMDVTHTAAASYRNRILNEALKNGDRLPSILPHLSYLSFLSF